MNDGRDYNWGCALGKPSGIFALDVDSDEALAWVEAHGGFGPDPISFTNGNSPGQWLYRLRSDLPAFTILKPCPALEVRGNRHR